MIHDAQIQCRNRRAVEIEILARRQLADNLWFLPSKRKRELLGWRSVLPQNPKSFHSATWLLHLPRVPRGNLNYETSINYIEQKSQFHHSLRARLSQRKTILADWDT